MLVTTIVAIMVIGYLAYMGKFAMDIYKRDLLDNNENY